MWNIPTVVVIKHRVNSCKWVIYAQIIVIDLCMSSKHLFDDIEWCKFPRERGSDQIEYVVVFILVLY